MPPTQWHQRISRGRVAIVLAAAVTSAYVAREFELFVVEQNKGFPTRPSALTTGGEIFFFGVGFVCGTGIGLAAMAMAHRILDRKYGWLVGAVGGIVIGIPAGTMATPMFGMLCITLPQDFLRVLFEFPP